MKNSVFQIFILFFLSSFVFAQSDNTPRIVDELGVANLEDLESRTHNFSIELNLNPTAVGHIKIFRRKNSSPISAYRYAARIKTYLTKIVKISPDRVVTEQCGEENEIRTQFLIVPSNANYENCSEELPFDKSKTFLFDSYEYRTDDDLGSCCVIGEFQEEEAIESLNLFSNFLKQSPHSKAYLLMYLSPSTATIVSISKSGKETVKPYSATDSPSLFGKFLKQAKTKLLKNGTDEKRIVSIKSGYKLGRRMELWFVPKGGEIPKPKPDYFPKKAK